MRQIIISLFSELFSSSEVNLKKHLNQPRPMLFDAERQVARRLRAHFRGNRRAA